ncbi:thioredoxin family protein [Alteromonas oceanisediminis]|uniref:thioredoxin family protein n=1 Tax=Alteromonas oceanisediminis TaxID=2836180 RepID=UPI001BDB6022|nr:thioredoxin family protein [Alteromonas oceanisediminis]MBT0586957.1 thioredoxin family protein [Alteromonas oceanisediminis]
MRCSAKHGYAHIALLSAVLLMPLHAHSASDTIDQHASTVKPEFIFKTKDNLQGLVDQAITTAQKDNTLLLLVLGAQWCHDSRGLAAQFSSDPLHSIITARFETLFVDVAYYNDLRWLTEQFGYPGYFATPSVMVIDPHSHVLLNRSSMPLWNQADSVSQEEYQRYFATVGENAHSDSALPQETRERLLSLSKQPTERLFTGLAKLSPMLRDAIENDPEDLSQLRALSNELYEFRIQLQKDIIARYESALSEPDKAMPFPDYGPFSWEIDDASQ